MTSATPKAAAKPKLVETMTRFARMAQAGDRMIAAHSAMMERFTVNMESAADLAERVTMAIDLDPKPESAVN